MYRSIKNDTALIARLKKGGCGSSSRMILEKLLPPEKRRSKGKPQAFTPRL
jgi:hypothetical protein